MKRSAMGFVLLLVLLALCIMVTVAMIRIHEPIEAHLLQAADQATAGDWEKTGRFFRQAEEQWKKWENFRSCVADHNPVEEIDAAFEMLKVFCAEEDKLSFVSGCLDLARKVAAVGETQELVWWNLL